MCVCQVKSQQASHIFVHVPFTHPHEMDLSPSQWFFLLTDIPIIYLSWLASKQARWSGLGLLATGLADVVFHGTGEQHSIIQHGIVFVGVPAFFNILAVILSLNKAAFLVGVSAYLLAIYLALVDGTPLTPGYDIWTSPGPKDPHWITGHTGVHLSAIVILSILAALSGPASNKGTKSA